VYLQAGGENEIGNGAEKIVAGNRRRGGGSMKAYRPKCRRRNISNNNNAHIALYLIAKNTQYSADMAYRPWHHRGILA